MSADAVIAVIGNRAEQAARFKAVRVRITVIIRHRHCGRIIIGARSHGRVIITELDIAAKVGDLGVIVGIAVKVFNRDRDRALDQAGIKNDLCVFTRLVMVEHARLRNCHFTRAAIDADGEDNVRIVDIVHIRFGRCNHRTADLMQVNRIAA